MTRTKNKLGQPGSSDNRKRDQHDSSSSGLTKWLVNKDKSNDGTTNSIGQPTKRRRRKTNKVMREIKFYQKTTNLLIPRLPFARLVKQIVDEQRPGTRYYWQASALQALQEMAESYLVSLLEDTNFVCINAKRKTIQVNDIFVVRKLRGSADTGNR